MNTRERSRETLVGDGAGPGHLPQEHIYLHLWMHAAVDGGGAPGWAGRDQAIS